MTAVACPRRDGGAESYQEARLRAPAALEHLNRQWPACAEPGLQLAPIHDDNLPAASLGLDLLTQQCAAAFDQYSAEEKICIVLKGLRGEENISELCCREGIAASM